MNDISAEHDPRPAGVPVTRPALAGSRGDDLVATATHEILTPLAVIVGYLEVLADTHGAVDPQFHQHVAVVIRNAGRLRTAVDDLLRATC